MKRKIAILTQPLTNNYGGILQAYALQKILESMGHNPVTVDRKGSRHSRLLTFTIKIVKRMLSLYNNKTVFNKKQLAEINVNSTIFIEKYINRTEPINNNKNMVYHFQNNDYDSIVVGSDQVWRPAYSPSIYNFYIDFETSAKKIISYAASFGVDQWEYSNKQTVKIKQLIKGFTAVSVREQGGVKLCSDFLGINAQLVLDPTMLLRKGDYLQLIDKLAKMSEEKRGVYTYILDKQDYKNKIVDFCSKVLEKPVYSSQPRERVNISSSREISDYVFPPVEEWIKGFHDADFVITDSFHGTVFSIIFNKPFIAIANQGRGLDRFHTLLSNFGLEDRLIYSLENLKDVEFIKKSIDYEAVNEKLDVLRKKSSEFLEKSI